VVKLERTLLVVMPLDALFDVALHAWQLLRRKPLQIETPQILAIGFAGIDMPGMLGKNCRKVSFHSWVLSFASKTQTATSSWSRASATRRRIEIKIRYTDKVDRAGLSSRAWSSPPANPGKSEI
jgi:hypothetical protein